MVVIYNEKNEQCTIKSARWLSKIEYKETPKNLKLLFSTSFADIYVDNELTKVLKIAYTDTKNKKRNFFDNEYKSYQAIAELNCPYLAKPIDYFTSEKYSLILMPYYGLDGMEMMRHNKITFSILTKAAWQLYDAIDTMDKNGITHFDIKLENIAFYNNKWTILDFGLCLNRNDKNKQMTHLRGSMPYIPPIYDWNNFEDSLRTIPYIIDIYGYALIILELAGVMSEQYEQFVSSYYRINIELMYRIAFGLSDAPSCFPCLDLLADYAPIKQNLPKYGFLNQIIRYCALIICSQVSTKHRYVVWDINDRTFTFQGRNEFYDEKLDVPDIKTLWRKLKEYL